MRKLVFDHDAFDDFTNWASFDRKIFVKIVELIDNIDNTPHKGLGKPEPLKFSESGYWTRRITEEHRLVYKVDNNTIYIASCKGHYKFKTI
jgi:toxin YoeB